MWIADNCSIYIYNKEEYNEVFSLTLRDKISPRSTHYKFSMVGLAAWSKSFCIMLMEITAVVYQRCRLESHWAKNNKLSAKITNILTLTFFAWMFRRFLKIFNKVRYPFRISWVDILYDVTFLRLYSIPAVYMGWKIQSLPSRQINHHPWYTSVYSTRWCIHCSEFGNFVITLICLRLILL